MWEDFCFTRAYSGVLDAGSYVYNTRTMKKERISRIFQMHANKQNQIPQLQAGDIAALIGFKDIEQEIRYVQKTRL